MATTFVFGAGASLHAGFPLASSLGAELLRYMQSCQIDGHRNAAQSLIESFGLSPDIEDVITNLQSRLENLRDCDNYEDRATRAALGSCLASLRDCLREWFRDIRRNPADSYAEFARKIIKAGDVVITFNYDDSLERELKRVGKWDYSCGYGFPIADPTTASVQVLKLHGSINWLVSIFDGVTSGPFAIGRDLSLGRQPKIHPADLEHLGYETPSGQLYRGGGAFPCLILPARKKEFFYDTSLGNEFTDFWDNLWAQASEALARSTDIVMCGYSLLPVDQRARELILHEVGIRLTHHAPTGCG